jgi:hypothetical protein
LSLLQDAFNALKLSIEFTHTLPEGFGLAHEPLAAGRFTRHFHSPLRVPPTQASGVWQDDCLSFNRTPRHSHHEFWTAHEVQQSTCPEERLLT